MRKPSVAVIQRLIRDATQPSDIAQSRSPLSESVPEPAHHLHNYLHLTQTLGANAGVEVIRPAVAQGAPGDNGRKRRFMEVQHEDRPYRETCPQGNWEKARVR